jgi:uncharacterized lipoprotein YmbA
VENKPARKAPFQISGSLVLATLGMTGCAGPISAPHYYMLNVPAPPALAQRPSLGGIAVREFDAASFLKGGRIAYRRSGTEIAFYEYHRWAVDPRRSATDAVIRQLQSAGTFRSVALFDGQETVDFLLTGTINHLEEVDSRAGVSVECSISAQLIDMKTGSTVWRGGSDKSAGLDQRSVNGVVELLSSEMQSAVQTLVGSMRDRLASATSATDR